MLFLTRGPMPHEALWTAWLAGARGHIQAECAAAAVCNAQDPDAAAVAIQRACAPDAAASTYAGQHMFSIYVHSAPDFEGYRDGSIFQGREIADRMETSWGHHSTTEVSRRMIMAALQDPLNQFFIQLSESCVPIYPPAMVHQQLLQDTRSRINACPDTGLDTNPYRWNWRMWREDFDQSVWRKNSQWFGLKRKHAELVAADDYISSIFEEHCTLETDGHWLGCLSDEHYLSTFLAFKGLANETDCTGSLTWDEWEWWLPAPPAHPKTYPAAEVNDALLQKIRAHDDNMCWMFPDAISTSAQLFTTPQLLLGGSSSGCQLQGGNYTFMPSFCSIFARKFKEDAAAPMLELMRGLPANISIFQGPTFPQNSTVWTCGDSGPGSGSQAAQSLEAQSASGADAGMSLAQQIPTRHLFMQHREPQVLAGTGRRHTAPTLEFE
eukprot:jgi/Astpho2/2641/fgenesh1_pg.00049_%23_18_t